MTLSNAYTPHARGTQRRSALAAGMIVALFAPAVSSAQQSLAQRIAGVQGEAELRFASRPGVCGNGEGSISFISKDEGVTGVRGDDWDYHCEPGPVRVRLAVSNGSVTRVRSYVGRSRDVTGGVTDLGTVGAREAADYFLGLARTASGDVARKAIVPAALADSVTVWPKLIDLARDRERPTEVRKPALFWAGQLGEGEVLEPVRAIANDNSENEAIRKHAIFVLSQLPDGAGNAALMSIARGDGEIDIRKQALFWIGQGETPTSELLQLYRQFPEKELKERMIFVLSQRDDSAAVDGLIDIARSDPDHSLRKKAFFWLGQKDDPRVVQLLTSILEK
ncbi:MAG TPA: HEAT repeat domain-containing protein [Gemmatimonadaceae bacterium]|nr:HEAT repeat domain-containing protein [Gemmatimonadaceae bacterium]